MLIQKHFLGRGNHLQGWNIVTDVNLEIAGEEGKEIIILTIISDEGTKLKIHLSKTDLTKITKMLGLINEITKERP